MTPEKRQQLYIEKVASIDPTKSWPDADRCALAQSDEEPQDVLTTVRKRIELVINEIADAELIAMLRTAMSELDLALAQSDAEPKNVLDMLEKAIIASTLPEHKATDAEFMRGSIRLANEFAKDALAALARSDAKQELGDIAAAIGSTRFMDAPDGGDVSLAEQVGRMREALEKAEARRYSLSDAEAMTNEERQELCEWLREASRGWSGSSKMKQAADEIERLAAIIQSDAEPVCPRCGGTGPHMHPKTAWEDRLDFDPPLPDASAGLIEAADADLIHDLADELGLAEWASPAEAETILRKLITKYHRRLNAADRSGK